MDYTKYGERNILRCENCGGEYQLTDDELRAPNILRKSTSDPHGTRYLIKHTCPLCNEYGWNFMVEKGRRSQSFNSYQTRTILIGIAGLVGLDILYMIISYLIKKFAG